MATLEKAPTSNFWSTSLNGAINDSVTTITLNSTVGLQAPGRLVINRQDSTGKNTPSAREVISFTGISGSDLTGVTRGADNSTARSHADGSLVESAMVVGNWDALYKVVNQEHSTSGVHSVADMVTGGSVIDDDTFATASATTLATSESIKAYADNSPDSIYRQAIINGNFDVWQRTTNVSLAPDAALFAADRWSCYSHHADYSFSRQDANLSGSQYCGRYQRASGSIGTNAMHMFYAGIEKSDAIKFRGKKLTLSFYAKKGANFSPSTFTAEIRTGTVGDENVWSMTNLTIIATLSPTLTTDWQKFTLTTSSVIASNVSEITIKFYTSACAGTAGAADYFDITQVQLCEGEVALPFMPKSYEEELRACQRYMEFLSGAVGRAISATVVTFGFSYKVTKRIAAGTTNVFFITGSNALEVNVSVRTFTTCDAAYPTVNGGTFDFGGASSMTSPNMVILGSDKIYVDVEL